MKFDGHALQVLSSLSVQFVAAHLATRRPAQQCRDFLVLFYTCFHLCGPGADQGGEFDRARYTVSKRDRKMNLPQRVYRMFPHTLLTTILLLSCCSLHQTENFRCACHVSKSK